MRGHGTPAHPSCFLTYTLRPTRGPPLVSWALGLCCLVSSSQPAPETRIPVTPVHRWGAEVLPDPKPHLPPGCPATWRRPPLLFPVPPLKLLPQHMALPRPRTFLATWTTLLGPPHLWGPAWPLGVTYKTWNGRMLPRFVLTQNWECCGCSSATHTWYQALKPPVLVPHLLTQAARMRPRAVAHAWNRGALRLPRPTQDTHSGSPAAGTGRP